MFGFGKDKENNKPAPVEQPKVERRPWEDGAADATPKRAAYFNAVRSDAFLNQNPVKNFVEFWAALQVDAGQDKWRVINYTLYDLDREDGAFEAKPVLKDDVSFAEAIAKIGQLEYAAGHMQSQTLVDMAAEFPADRYPELKTHFFDIEHYKPAGNIEGFVFNEYNEPYRRLEGKVLDGAFMRSEVNKSILTVEEGAHIPKVRAQVEGGILSDIFSTAANRTATLDGLLKVGQALSGMDKFATEIGAFYLGIQRILGIEHKFDAIEGLTPAEKQDMLNRAQDRMDRRYVARLPAIGDVLESANEKLDELDTMGVHTEPFRKFTAECSLYIYLLHASQNLSKLERGLVSVSNTDVDLITQIRDSVDTAQRRFVDLGGTAEQMDRLKAWVATYARVEADSQRSGLSDDDKQKLQEQREKMIPAWLPGFLTRLLYVPRQGHEAGAGT
jgi:hypothetical protein